jgi:hypothetical protein
MSSEKFEKGGDGVAQVMSRQSALAGEKERQELERLGYTQVMKRNRSARARYLSRKTQAPRIGQCSRSSSNRWPVSRIRPRLQAQTE